jgi:hypothetical protein
MNPESRKDGVPRRTYTAKLACWRFYKITEETITAGGGGTVAPRTIFPQQTFEPAAGHTIYLRPGS